MKAFLLAAGEGRRLRPLTRTVPKCLVPIHGTPLLAIWLRLFEAHGVTDVLVNVHHLHEQVTAFLRTHQTGVSVHTVYEPRLLGSAGTVIANRAFVDDAEYFFVVYADNLTTVHLRDLAAFHRSRCEPLTMGIVETAEPREKGIVVVGAGGSVVKFEEKPARPRSRTANAGIYAAGHGLFPYLEESLASRRALDFGYDVVPRMVPNVAAYPIEDFLMDIGTPEAYARAQRLWPGLPCAPAVSSLSVGSERR